MEYDYLWEDGPQMLKGPGFRLSTDSVLLGNFVNLNGISNGIDLGCASGIISLLLLSLSDKIRMTGIEIDEKEAELAGLNMEKNALQERSEIICADLREHRKLFRAGSFDLIVSNPPYFPMTSGSLSPNENRARARGEVSCTLEDLCEAARYLCRWGGRFALVHKPERLSELMCCMSKYGLEMKRLRLVCHKADSAPSLILAEGKRGAAPGLTIEPPLILTDAFGNDSEEIKRIYHRGA